MTAKTKSVLKVTLPSDTEIRMTREFNAPRELVFRAFTDPRLIEKWWGRRKHTTVVDKLELKPGGAWRFICRDEGGSEFAFRGEFKDVLWPEKLVYTFEFEPMPGHIATENVKFDEKHGRTTVTSVMQCASKADRDGMVRSGMEEGAAETYDRLEEFLSTLA